VGREGEYLKSLWQPANSKLLNAMYWRGMLYDPFWIQSPDSGRHRQMSFVTLPLKRIEPASAEGVTVEDWVTKGLVPSSDSHVISSPIFSGRVIRGWVPRTGFISIWDEKELCRDLLFGSGNVTIWHYMFI